MDNIKKHLQNAFTLLSSVSVNGDNVDLLAAARQELRNAFAAVSEKEEAEKDRDLEAKEECPDV